MKKNMLTVTNQLHFRKWKYFFYIPEIVLYSYFPTWGSYDTLHQICIYQKTKIKHKESKRLNNKILYIYSSTVGHINCSKHTQKTMTAFKMQNKCFEVWYWFGGKEFPNY